MSIVIYVDNFQTALDYYTCVLGLKLYGAPGENTCFLYLGDDPNGIYLEGRYAKQVTEEKSTRLSFMLNVHSVMELYEKLKSESVPLVHKSPKKIGENSYWFQFYDPAGNMLEAVGGA